MNVAVTNLCTRRCPFCYQRDVMETARLSKETEMPLEKFSRVVNFIKNSGENKLHLVGGEPTIHGRFNEIMDLVGEDPAIHQVTLFTNGAFKSSALESITKYAKKILLSVNVLEPCYENPRRLQQLHENLSALVRKGVVFDLSYVISERDFNPSFLFEYVDRYKIGSLRWALAFPVVEGASYIPKEELRNVGKKVVTFLRALAARDVQTYVDCPLPYCIFSDADLGFLSREALSVNNWGYCGLTLEVNPDLTVKACPVQEEQERVPFSFFSNMKEMERYFFSKISVYKANHMLFEDCSDCRYYQDYRCQGGCLGYSKERFSNIKVGGTNSLDRSLRSDNIRVRPLPFLEVKEEMGRYYIYSCASPQVQPEALDARHFEFWKEIMSMPEIGALFKEKSPENKEAMHVFIEHLQRIGFVDLLKID